MKKVLLFIAAAALTLSSCVKEQFAGAEGNIETVSFGLALDNGVQTRADGDAPIADKLYYAVFDENDALIAEFKATSQNVTEYPASVDIRLTKGQTYTVAFWAQNSTTDAYTVSDDLKITVNYNKANNDVKRDAFFGKETFTVGESSNNHEVTLTRPFAQLNVGITDEDLEAAAKTGVVIANSAVKVSGIADSFDVFTGTATGSVDAVYTLGKVPTAALTVGTDVYNWLSMSYLLIDSKTTSTIELTFDPADQSKTDITIREGLSNIPLQRNWRTNIVGNLLTGNVHFEISLLEDFIEPGYKITDEDLNGVIPADEFYARLQEGGAVYVNEARNSIDFNNLEIAQETVVILNEKVDEIKLGGNKAVDTKAASTMPNITIVIPKDVEYPAFSFNAKTENYTIQGDLETSNPLTTKIITTGTVKNFTVENVKATGDAMIDANNGTTGLTVKNCVATDLNAAFVDIFEIRDAKILNNTIALAASAQPEGDARHAITVWNCGDDILIEGNTITKTYKHGIFAQGVGTSALTIKDNKISGVVEDGIKIDRSHKVVVTGNVIDAADYGIRVDRLMPSLGTADITITDNTISIDDGFDGDGADATAIRVRHRNEKEFAGEVTVNLTAKDNKVGTNGIPAGKYADFTSEGMTVTGDYEFPFSIADGLLMSHDSKTYGVSNANGLRYFAANPATNMTVKLTNDIDLAGGNWTPINSWNGVYNGLVLDGAGYSIKNMSIQYNDTDSAYGFFASNASSMTIKNLTFDKAVVNDKSGKSTRYAGVVMGKNYSNVTIENVHVTNSAVINNWQCGGLVGFAETNAPVFVNCSISDSFVGGYNATAGAFFGLGRVAVTCTGCVATNVDLYTDMAPGLVGSLYGNPLTATDCEMTNVNVVSEYPAGL